MKTSFQLNSRKKVEWKWRVVISILRQCFCAIQLLIASLCIKFHDIQAQGHFVVFCWSILPTLRWPRWFPLCIYFKCKRYLIYISSSFCIMMINYQLNIKLTFWWVSSFFPFSLLSIIYINYLFLNQ